MPYIQIGNPLIKLLQVDSTNNYAHWLINKGNVANGTAILAQHQTNGRGQMGKTWNAIANQNILTSIIVDISTTQLQNQFTLLATIALACLDFFKKHTSQKTAIKWSNDIFINDNKAAGILIETTNFNSKRYAIIGLGLNINQTNFDETLPKPTSLKLINNKEYHLETLVKDLYKSLSLRLSQIQNSKNILKEYNQNLYKQNQVVCLRKNNIKFSCIIKRVNAFGELEVDNCIYDKFGFGEVKWIF